jgi:hypothetical protein
MFGRITMPNWKADLDALVEETMAFTRSIHAQQPTPRTVVEPNGIPPVKWIGSQRDEIERHVAKFKAHQQRIAQEREDYAESELRRMLKAVVEPSAAKPAGSSGR